MKTIYKIIFILVLAGSFILLTKHYLPLFLAYNKPVNSSNYLIESWISANEIEQVVKALGQVPGSRFYLTGYVYPEAAKSYQIKTKPEYSQDYKDDNRGVWLWANSTISFAIPEAIEALAGDTLSISVNLRGREACGEFPHFNMIVNGKKIGGDFVQEEFQDFTFHWLVSEKGLQSIFVRFNNDLWTDSTDRNMNIRYIRIGNVTQPATYKNTLKTRDVNKLTTGFDSQAEELGDYLSSLGIDHDRIKVVCFQPAEINQTLAAAKRFQQYVASTPINSINVISTQIHSRRTWITYKKILGKQVSVGLLYFPDNSHEQSGWYKKTTGYFRLMDEFISYMVNWFVLTI